jgi:hypothetical protein
MAARAAAAAATGWSTVVILPDGQVRQEGRPRYRAGTAAELSAMQGDASTVRMEADVPQRSLTPAKTSTLLPRPETFLHDWPPPLPNFDPDRQAEAEQVRPIGCIDVHR